MFRFHKPLDTVTLFHKASSPASMRVAALLKQVSAQATETATEDQASDHAAQSRQHQQRAEFDLQITEDAPTPDQLQTILEYIGAPSVGAVIKGARTPTDALKLYKQKPDSFQWPLVVDWNNGRAAAGADESKILKMLNELNKEK
ncbi:hypothetical protein MAPG_02410 [Magnaporthiopsis poae ATCC 64411]|uniref:DUF1687 domain-containing protein n=1 Tax=Magnaporthiopsis poae (strain ATCC 64411 / 73-15) TaxID=644358 RepID=A0A0C4DRA3_MAGP6|nr:hypothetical protein MAPG_02410 [Magnaporthiopsis poae ATCC 64411]